MATELDGYPVNIGDRIYDIYDERWLTVRQVFSNRFMVDYKTSQGPVSRTYNYQGVGARRRGRTAYWHDPRICLPAKGAQNWAEQKRVLKAIMNDVAQLPTDQNPTLVEDTSQFTQLEVVQNQFAQDSAFDLQSGSDTVAPTQAQRDAEFQAYVAKVQARQNAEAREANPNIGNN